MAKSAVGRRAGRHKMIFVYVIQSLKKNFKYVGITRDLADRLKRHNGGRNRSTKLSAPLIIIYTEKFESYSEARIREKFLKSGAGREYLNTLSS
ncbi:MAG: GIY-YIG nuclease family protein [Patescibacteria group bacterium]